MGPIKINDKTPLKRKSWAEINKIHKEERKKWRDESLQKKLEPQETSCKSPDLKDSMPEEPSKTTLRTISIAVPGSIMDNAQSPVLRTYLAGQIARAACIFQVDEVVVFDDLCGPQKGTAGVSANRTSYLQLGRILQYLECPQYLRRSFFPIHKDLEYCGLLNPLNTPHHLTASEESPFREGVVTNKPVKAGKGSLISVGLLQDVQVDKQLTPGLRCTVELKPAEGASKKLKGVVVSPLKPRQETGVYWGYNVRVANSLSKIFSESPYEEGYDLTLGTSDKGENIDEFSCPSYNHLLVVFGGLQGLEAALENDEVLKVDDPKLLFDFYLNTLPLQGTKTIRTEEAILVSLAALRPHITI